MGIRCLKGPSRRARSGCPPATSMAAGEGFGVTDEAAESEEMAAASRLLAEAEADSLLELGS